MMNPVEDADADYGKLRQLPRGIRCVPLSLRQTGLQRMEMSISRLVKRLIQRSSSGERRGERTASRSVSSAVAGQRDTDSLGRRLRRLELAGLFFHQADDWTNRAVATGLAMCADQPYDIVVSSGPPHMAHLAARRIARAVGIPFAIDLRDPIVHDALEPNDMRSDLWRFRMLEWERLCVSDAALVVVTAEGMRTSLAARYPELGSRFLTVMNGADPDFRITPEKTPTFIIASTGSIYMGRDPRPLLQGLSRVVSKRNPDPHEIQIHFMGGTSVDGVPLERLAEEAGVARYTVVEATRPRHEVRALISRAAVLTLLPQAVPETIPAKLFEYVMAPAWVLALAESGSSAEVLLRGTAADVLEPSDVAGIARTIERRWESFRQGVRPQPLNSDGRFDRALQARTLFDALDRLLGTR
jgi:hypothetical protein